MSWRKWNIRAELEGAELKPHEKPKINLDVSKKRKNVASSVFSKNIHLYKSQYTFFTTIF